MKWGSRCPEGAQVQMRTHAYMHTQKKGRGHVCISNVVSMIVRGFPHMAEGMCAHAIDTPTCSVAHHVFVASVKVITRLHHSYWTRDQAWCSEMQDLTPGPQPYISFSSHSMASYRNRALLMLANLGPLPLPSSAAANAPVLMADDLAPALHAVSASSYLPPLPPPPRVPTALPGEASGPRFRLSWPWTSPAAGDSLHHDKIQLSRCHVPGLCFGLPPRSVTCCASFKAATKFLLC